MAFNTQVGNIFDQGVQLAFRQIKVNDLVALAAVKMLMVSCIDNLLKGAVGQAVQNMNLMFGLPEDAGLRLKASAF